MQGKAYGAVLRSALFNCMHADGEDYYDEDNSDRTDDTGERVCTYIDREIDR